MKNVFFRNDDVCHTTYKFNRFHEIFKRNNIPIIHAVIPGQLSEECKSFLIREKQNNPESLSLVQHGWLHKNYGRLRKYEFGPSRDYNQQKQDIESGFKVMKDTFGNQFTKLFVPPFHIFNKNTTKVIKELGFLGFSSSNSNKVGESIKNYPTSLNFTIYSRIKTKNKDLKEILKEYLKFKKSSKDVVGILFHHEEFDEKSFQTLEKFLAFIRHEEKNHNIKILTGEELVKDGI